MEPYSESILWMVILGFIIAFILAFGIGANDVANSFGTSVGSGVLTLKQACILATVCEVSGAVLIGYKVSDTMRKGILDVSLYENSENELMLGCVSALFSCAAWLLLATFLKLPISGTHSIVGSTIGFSIVARGTQGLKWSTLGTIVGTWFISPVLSGFVSTVLYLAIRKFILRAKEPLKNGFIALPIFYGVTIFINVISIVLDGSKLLCMDNIPVWISVLLSAASGVVIATIVQFCLVPMQMKKIKDNMKSVKSVKFDVKCSNESSPIVSPKKRRKISIVSDSNQLHTIAEITELVTLNDGFGYPSNKIAYKIDPDVIKKAEKLLGQSSLDNADLTITSLSYIDEQQNSYLNNGKKLHADIDNNISNKSPINTNNNEIFNSIGDDITKRKYSKDQFLPFNNHSLKFNDSETNINLMISNATLSANSSRIPLIEDKGDKANKTSPDNEDNDESISMLFSFLQILTAAFGSFAHGGNDVSNAIGPLVALYMIYKEGSVLQNAETPFFILIYGGIGISAGLWLWGRRVIETIGTDLTKITPSKGFTIEIGSAITVLLASKIGLPISTTHCKVGSIVFVGYMSSTRRENTDFNEFSTKSESSGVDWHLFRNIAYAWVVTVPVTAMLSAAIMYSLSQFVL